MIDTEVEEMKFTKRQLKLIGYCVMSEYYNVESNEDCLWYIWSHLGYGDREEAIGNIEGGTTPLHNPDEVELKDKLALVKLQEVIDIIKRMEEEE